MYNLSRRFSFQVDCLIIDEAGQLALSSTALVVRSLSSSGRIIIAGDSEQLAPILTAQYPLLDTRLFGSILDCLMHLSNRTPNESDDGTLLPPPSYPIDASQGSASQIGAIVQLTENFRYVLPFVFFVSFAHECVLWIHCSLNPDLGEFVSTIYQRAFKPQKTQTRRVAERFTLLRNGTANESDTLRDVREFLLALSDAMLCKPQTLLQSPRFGAKDDALVPNKVNDIPSTSLLPISLALIRLETHSMRPERVGYEAHVRGEAAVAAALVSLIRECSPDDDIFVATPHRVQRQAVKEALISHRRLGRDGDLADALESLQLSPSESPEKVTVDTVERLQGSFFQLFENAKRPETPVSFRF